MCVHTLNLNNMLCLLYLNKSRKKDTDILLARASQAALVVKKPSANTGDIKHVGSIPGPGRVPGGGHGNPLQYSCHGQRKEPGGLQSIGHKESDKAEAN